MLLTIACQYTGWRITNHHLFFNRLYLTYHADGMLMPVHRQALSVVRNHEHPSNSSLMRVSFSVTILILTQTLLFAPFAISCSNHKSRNNTELKPATIPADAFFVKGKNQNYWCQAEVHDHRNNAFIKVYEATSGKLIQSKRFMVICKLEGNPIWIEDLKNQIDYFDGEKFHLKRPKGKDSCWLQ